MKPLSLSISLLLLTTTLMAQSWQWGQNGGSVGSVVGGIAEEAIDIATDPHGNVYLITTLYTFIRFIGGSQNTLYTGPGYGSYGAVLVSYDCEGNFRWAKVFATTPGAAFAKALAVDEVGGVYVGTYMALISASTEAKIDVDTSFVAPLREYVIVKYDTSGVFQWVRNPVPDTTTQRKSGVEAMSVTPDGHLYTYGSMQAGLLAGSDSVVTDSFGAYVLHYTPSGLLQSATRLDMSGPGIAFPRYFARDHRSGRYYVCGQYGCCLTLGGQPLSGTNYVGAFDSTGQFLWLRQNATFYANGRGFRDDPEIDQAGNIYLVGSSSHGDQFEGSPILNDLDPNITSTPFVVVLDSNGNTLWLSNGRNENATRGKALALKEDGNERELAVAGEYPRLLIWADDTVKNIPNEGYSSFIARFDVSGWQGRGLDTLQSNFGSSNYPTVLTADAKGNFYLGGRMAGSGLLYVGPDTLGGYGGNYDFFVAKFGSDNCAICTDPLAGAASSYDSSSLSVPFQFTGAANYDSLVWTFGDGTSDTAANPTHTYAQPGVYTACVRVFNACGSDSACVSLTACLPTVAAFTAQDSFLQVAFDGSGSSGYDSLRWTFGDGSSDTALAPTHSYAQPGSYEVCLQAYGFCAVDSLCDSVRVEQAVGITEAATAGVLQLRPNPSSGAVAVVYRLPQPGGSLTLYDAQGRALRQQRLTQPAGVWQADLRTLPEGLYLVVLRQGGQVLAREKLSLRR